MMLTKKQTEYLDQLWKAGFKYERANDVSDYHWQTLMSYGAKDQREDYLTDSVNKYLFRKLEISWRI